MILTLDGRKIESRVRNGGTLQDVISDARQNAPDGRIIASVRVNGIDLVGDELLQQLSSAVEPDAQVDLDSADAREVCAAALRGGAEALEIADTLREEIVSGLRTQIQPADAFQQLGEALHAWQVVNDALQQSSALLGQNLQLQQHAGRPIREHTGELAGWLQELRASFEARDFVLLADQIEFELPERSENWRALLRDLADQLS